MNDGKSKHIVYCMQNTLYRSKHPIWMRCFSISIVYFLFFLICRFKPNCHYLLFEKKTLPYNCRLQRTTFITFWRITRKCFYSARIKVNTNKWINQSICYSPELYRTQNGKLQHQRRLQQQQCATSSRESDSLLLVLSAWNHWVPVISHYVMWSVTRTYRECECEECLL